jgi:hypothetical protein
MLLLTAPLLLSAQVSATDTIENEQIMAQTHQEFGIMLRGGGEAYEFGSNGFGYGYNYGDEYGDGDELQQGRRLWGISWSNLFCTFIIKCCNETRIHEHHVL